MERENRGERPRLVRPVNGQSIGGVCSAFGNHLGIDPTLVRLAWIIGAFAVGFWVAAVAYVIALIIIPAEGNGAKTAAEGAESTDTIRMEADPENAGAYRPVQTGRQGMFWIGVFVTGMGLYLLADNFLDISRYLPSVRAIAFASLLILIGGYLILRRK